MKYNKINFFYNFNLLQFLMFLLLFALANNAAAESPYEINLKKLACSPRVLHFNGTLTLNLGSMHGSEFAIRRKSDGAFFMLVLDSPESNITQLMTSKEFSEAKVVKLSTKVKALPYEVDASIEPIFTKSGTYEILVSDNIESDLGGYYCNVKYLAK